MCGMSLLKRRTPHGFFKKTKEALWPSQGWCRTLRYYRHRLFRTGDSTYKITAGLALGASLSFVPLIGTHLAQAGLGALLIRANFIAAFLGTAAGNPWTFPFMFWLSYKTGIVTFALFGWTDFKALPAFMNASYFMNQPMDFMHYLASHPVQLFLPMLVGGYICALLSWPVFYAVSYYPVRQLQKLYRFERKQGLLKKRGKKHDRKNNL